MFDIQEADANRDWVAHYAAVKARINRTPIVARPIFIPPVKRAPIPANKPRDILKVATKDNGPSFYDVLSATCVKYNVRAMDILSTRRTGSLTIPRFEICYRMKMETGLSLPVIGKLMKRDHTSILNSVRRYTAMLEAGEVTL